MSATPPSVTPPSSPSKAKTFAVRLGSTLFLWAVMSVAFVNSLDWMFLGILVLLGIGGTWEYFRLRSGDVLSAGYMRLALCASVAYWGGFAWLSVTHHRDAPLWLDAVALIMMVQATFAVVFCSNLDGERTLIRIFNCVFGFLYTTLMISYLGRILYLEGVASRFHLLLMVIMVTKFCDMGAYAFGTVFGKHRMIPHISPAKSWEGFAGAIFTSFLTMAILMWWIPEKLLPLTWGHAMILAPLLCILAVMGDLAESVLKRCHQIKDSGHKLPGIGGILDLTDSLFFTAPVVYFYLKALGAGA